MEVITFTFLHLLYMYVAHLGLFDDQVGEFGLQAFFRPSVGIFLRPMPVVDVDGVGSLLDDPSGIAFTPFGHGERFSTRVLAPQCGKNYSHCMEHSRKVRGDVPKNQVELHLLE